MSAVGGTRRLQLVRHGQSTWNVERRVQGQTPHVPLSALGRAQAQAIGRQLATDPPALLLTSDLERAVQTAAAITAATGVAARPDRRLREQGYGTFEGRLSLDVAGEDVDWTDPAVRFGGGESLDDVYARVGGLLDELLALPVPAGPITLVTHGDTIRVALARLRGHGSDGVPHMTAPNASITEVTIIGDRLASERIITPQVRPEPASGP